MTGESILVTGANGQIGTVLCEALSKKYGADAILATDIRENTATAAYTFEKLDITDKARLEALVVQYQITQIYHLAAILSAKGEQNPMFTWNINMNGLFNVLEVARAQQLRRVFFPSSIAVFGDQSPPVDTPQDTILNPSTIYGISKRSGELWCDYYHHNFQLDVRSLRYPGIISYQSLAGGGTTDYAVDIFHYAVQGKAYECFLSSDTRLPMIYMPDAIRATLELMEAPKEQIQVRSSYNLAGMSFTPAELSNEIRQFIPKFEVSYKPDFRQKIADSWSDSIDDTPARRDWNWQPEFDLSAMTADMIRQLHKRYPQTQISI
ncbi:MAG: NAD-dependent epimerase/dehydratase family protein [Bacteroidota bacterium]